MIALPIRQYLLLRRRSSPTFDGMNEQRNPDVVIVGGGAAGSSAALVLGRARADVTLIDAGRPSNSPSTGIGGLLGNDGTEPADFYRRASEELAAYPTITRRRATVEAIHSEGSPRWRLELDDGDTVLTDRLLLATGMAYTLPSIDGLEERWGASVFHCPFCHGWEHRDQPLGVLGGPAERALLLHRWTNDLTLITHGTDLTDEEVERLEARGIRIVDGEVVSLDGPGRDIAYVTLADDTRLPLRGLMVAAPHRFRQPQLFSSLDLATTPSGHIRVDEVGATSVAGVWAVGDLTSPMASVARAIAAGSTAAAAITHDLVAASWPTQVTANRHRRPDTSQR